MGRRNGVLALIAALALAVGLVSAATSGKTHRVVAGPGLSAEPVSKGGGAPPDTTGAIGPKHYIETVNARIGIYRRSDLNKVATREAHKFWGRPLGGTVVDPQVAWDARAHRWYYVALYNTARVNELMLAWSRRGDPSNLRHGWCRTTIARGKLFSDFPTLGFDHRHLLISTNVGDLTTRKLLFGRVYVVGKPGGGPRPCRRPPVTAFGNKKAPLKGADGRPPFNLAPAIPVHQSGAGYVVASGESRRRAQLTVWHVSGTRRDPKLKRDGGIRIARYRLPTPVPQPGAKGKINTSDTGLTQAVSAPDPTRGGREAIWTQHTVAGPGGRSEVRWYEVDPRRLRLMRRGRIANRDNWVFNAAISPTWRGSSAVIEYNVGGPHRLVQIRARSRDSDTAANAMTDAVTLGRSAAAARRAFPGGCVDGLCAWGDYSGASPDPVRKSLVWGANELNGSPEGLPDDGRQWRTRIFALKR